MCHDYAMLCYAMLCYAMLCYAMLRYAMLRYATLCYAMLCYAMLYYAMLCYALLARESTPVSALTSPLKSSVSAWRCGGGVLGQGSGTVCAEGEARREEAWDRRGGVRSARLVVERHQHVLLPPHERRRMQQREVELLGELDKFRRALGRYVLEGSEADRLVQAEEELAEAQELEERLRQDLRREREQLAKVTARAEAAEAKLLEDARAEL